MIVRPFRHWIRSAWCKGAVPFVAAAATAVLFAPSAAFGQKGDYEEWLKRQRQEYRRYLSKQDQAFLQFLEEEWPSKAVKAPIAEPVDDKPREVPRVEIGPRGHERPPSSSEESRRGVPPSTPVTSEEEGATPTEPLPTGQTPTEGEPDFGNAPESPSAEAEAEPSDRDTGIRLSREASLTFFGTSTKVPYAPGLAPPLEGTLKPSSIRQFWKTMAEGPYRPTLHILQKRREALSLGDWGYFLYLRELSAQLYGISGSNAAVLWTWFMLMKSDYAARVGYQEGQVLLMLPVQQKIYDRPQMHVAGQRYYLMTQRVDENLRTYEGQPPGDRRALRLGKGLPDLDASPERDTVTFSFREERHKLTVAHNPAVVDYLQAYPNVELGVLLGAGVSGVAKRSLTEALRPLVDGRPPREAMNLLLAFAQFSTDYKRDQDHFGEERYLFPEETLASDYSDCEDRTVLLAYLTRTLLGRKVVGLQWPNHVALAVRAGSGLRATSEDHTVTVDGDTYIYADPTYIGSDLGMKMPLVEGQTPEIITLGR